MSLPLVFGTTLEAIPAKTPYLAARDDLIPKWRDRLGATSFKIGICWQGKSTYIHDADRSFPVTWFEALSKLPDVRLINLHKGDGEEAA